MNFIPIQSMIRHKLFFLRNFLFFILCFTFFTISIYSQNGSDSEPFTEDEDDYYFDEYGEYGGEGSEVSPSEKQQTKNRKNEPPELSTENQTLPRTEKSTNTEQKNSKTNNNKIPLNGLGHFSSEDFSNSGDQRSNGLIMPEKGIRIELATEDPALKKPLNLRKKNKKIDLKIKEENKTSLEKKLTKINKN